MFVQIKFFILKRVYIKVGAYQLTAGTNNALKLWNLYFQSGDLESALIRHLNVRNEGNS